MPKYDFNKVAKELYWNRTSAWVFSILGVKLFQMNTFCIFGILSKCYENEVVNVSYAVLER